MQQCKCFHYFSVPLNTVPQRVYYTYRLVISSTACLSLLKVQVSLLFCSIVTTVSVHLNFSSSTCTHTHTHTHTSHPQYHNTHTHTCTCTCMYMYAHPHNSHTHTHNSHTHTHTYNSHRGWYFHNIAQTQMHISQLATQTLNVFTLYHCMPYLILVG